MRKVDHLFYDKSLHFIQIYHKKPPLNQFVEISGLGLVNTKLI